VEPLRPLHEVTAVDATGAGDAFAGTLAVYLARGASLIEAGTFAGGAAALATTQFGAAEASLGPVELPFGR
jgi:ribokinase